MERAGSDLPTGQYISCVLHNNMIERFPGTTCVIDKYFRLHVHVELTPSLSHRLLPIYDN